MSTTSDPDRTPAQPRQSADDGYPGLPTWVKWTLLAILAVGLVLVLVRLVGGGNHGPGRHASAAGTTIAASIVHVLDR